VCGRKGNAECYAATRAVPVVTLSLGLQAAKEQELAQLRTVEEGALAGAVLARHAGEQRERGELAELHAKHETLRECAVGCCAAVFRFSGTAARRACITQHCAR
jgi:hypothetical protein